MEGIILRKCNVQKEVSIRVRGFAWPDNAGLPVKRVVIDPSNYIMGLSPVSRVFEAQYSSTLLSSLAIRLRAMLSKCWSKAVKFRGATVHHLVYSVTGAAWFFYVFLSCQLHLLALDLDHCITAFTSCATACACLWDTTKFGHSALREMETKRFSPT